MMKLFRSDRIPCAVLNISAGGVGISLHGERQRLSLISPSWSAIELIQTVGRVRRAGGSHSVQKILFASGTVEEAVCARVRSKVGCIETLNDGDTQGIQIKRKATPKPASPTSSRGSRPKVRPQSAPGKPGPGDGEDFQPDLPYDG